MEMSSLRGGSGVNIMDDESSGSACRNFDRYSEGGMNGGGGACGKFGRCGKGRGKRGEVEAAVTSRGNGKGEVTNKTNRMWYSSRE